MDESILTDLYRATTGVEPAMIAPMAASGSSRRYYLLQGHDGHRIIGTMGTDRKENEAFIYLAEHFGKCGLPVPEVVAVSSDGMAYLQTAVGGSSLFDEISSGRATGKYSDAEIAMLRNAVRLLASFQLRGAQNLDFNRCYPVAEFGNRDIMWDLNYFKYCYLKPAGVEFNETLLEDDFARLASNLLDVPQAEWGFLHRDFQSRNIMIDDDGAMSVIDFQGGRRGPIYYDLAALLWQAKARVPDELRHHLAEEYFTIIGGDQDAMRRRLNDFVLFRTLQVLGAYGFRGLVQRKPHFIESIPYALENVKTLLGAAVAEYPHLASVLAALCEQYEKKALVVTVTSFSYKKGIPEDVSGNGGGFVFDCRAVHNPGRYERYKPLTGLDGPVIEFLENDGEILLFLDSVYALVDASVKRYKERGFTSLSVNFGCTGGQHRSVYCAQKLAEHINREFGVAVRLQHREQNINRYFPAL